MLTWMTYKEGDEDGGVHQNQGQERSPAVSKTSSDRTCEEDTDKGTTLAGLEERALPLGGDRVSSAVDEDAIAALERGEGDKVAVQEHVERLHDLLISATILPNTYIFQVDLQS